MIVEKKYFRPSSIQQALEFAQSCTGEFSYIAGGTDVLVNQYQGNNTSRCLIDITGIDSLRAVTATDGYISIGALVKLDDLKKHKILSDLYPALLTAAGEVASPILRKTATLGGNILCENRCSFFNQSEWWRESVGYCLKCDGDVCIATGGKKACFSKFVSDCATVLISAGAKIVIVDKEITQTVALESIYTGDGIKPRSLSPTAIVSAIILPLEQQYKVVFKKLRPRLAVDFTSLTTSVSLDGEGAIKIVIGGTDPKPVVVKGVRSGNVADYVKQAISKCRVVDNDYYSRTYRREMMKLFLEQSLDELLNK